VLARRIDETPKFIASALSSFAVEWIGAAFFARAADIELKEITGRALFSVRSVYFPRMGSTRMGTASSSVHPSEQGTGPSSSKEALAASRAPAHGEAKAAAPSLARRSEAAAARRQLLAVKIAHEELGEKTALLIGCAVAAHVGGFSSEWAVKALALLLLEAVSDMAKAGTYRARRIDVGHVRFNFYSRNLLAVAFVGAASWAMVLVAISMNCLIGEDIASILG
jgi:hypothetical protein